MYDDLPNPAGGVLERNLLQLASIGERPPPAAPAKDFEDVVRPREDGLEDLADWKAVLAVTDPVDESREGAKAIGILGVDRLGVEGRPEGALEGARLVGLRARLEGEQRQRIQADAGERRAEGRGDGQIIQGV